MNEKASENFFFAAGHKKAITSERINVRVRDGLGIILKLEARITIGWDFTQVRSLSKNARMRGKFGIEAWKKLVWYWVV